jgi:CheY-like chemotaxis protein
MKMRLQKEAPGFEIRTFAAGGEFLEHLKSGNADCILSDYQMPIMNGMQLLSIVRGMGHDVPFIFITGQGNEELAREAFKNGANDYFTKDIGFAHFTRIINSIEQAVRQRRLEGERKMAESALLEEKNKLEAVLGSIGEGISIQDRDLIIIYENKALTDIKGSHLGEKCYEIIGQETVCEGCPVVESFADGENHTQIKRFGNPWKDKTLEIIASPVRNSAGEIVAGVKVVRDITEQIDMVSAVRNIAAGVSAETGEGFFNSLVQYLAKTLDVDFAFVGKLAKDDDRRIETISVFMKGAFIENFNYSLDNTPCDNVVGKELCSYPRDVQNLFPEDEMLVQMGIESYVGTPLFDSSGQPLGILVVLHSLPLANEELIKSVLTIFATRASGELERNKLEQQRVDFLSVVTNDLKSPLAAVMGSAELIAGGGRGEDEVRNIALGIIKSGKKISEMVNNLLKISKL